MRGSIRRRGSNSWELQIEQERVGSKRQRRFVSFKGSKKEASAELAKLLTAANEGTLADPTDRGGVCATVADRHERLAEDVGEVY